MHLRLLMGAAPAWNLNQFTFAVFDLTIDALRSRSFGETVFGASSDVSGDGLPHRLEHHKGFIGQRCFEGVQVSGSSGRRAQQPAERMRAKLRAELRTATEDDP